MTGYQQKVVLNLDNKRSKQLFKACIGLISVINVLNRILSVLSTIGTTIDNSSSIRSLLEIEA